MSDWHQKRAFGFSAGVIMTQIDFQKQAHRKLRFAIELLTKFVIAIIAELLFLAAFLFEERIHILTYLFFYAVTFVALMMFHDCNTSKKI